MKFTANYSVTIILILFASISFFCCEDDEGTCIPSCLADQIASIAKFDCEGSAGIIQYYFQGQVVYYIDPGHCFDDQSYEVVNSNCMSLGFLGGIIGENEINGVDFFENAIQLSIVWSK